MLNSQIEEDVCKQSAVLLHFLSSFQCHSVIHLPLLCAPGHVVRLLLAYRVQECVQNVIWRTEINQLIE